MFLVRLERNQWHEIDKSTCIVCIEKQNKLKVHKKQIAMKSVVVMWISMINDLIKIQDKVEQRLNNLLKYSINY